MDPRGAGEEPGVERVWNLACLCQSFWSASHLCPEHSHPSNNVPISSRTGCQYLSSSDLESIHRPDGCCTAVVTKEDICLAVAAVIAGMFDVPAGPRVSPDDGASGLGQSVDGPNGHRSIVMLPDDVGLAVAVEIAGIHHVPGRTGLGL